MNPAETRRLADLARRLGVPARSVLLAAASMAQRPDADPAAILAALRAGRFSTQDDAAGLALLLTPPSAYALGHVEDALTSLWGHAPAKVP